MLTFLTSIAVGLLIGIVIGGLIGSLFTYFYMRKQLYKVRDYAMEKAKGVVVDGFGEKVTVDEVLKRIRAKRSPQ